jgi:hypothetical protein
METKWLQMDTRMAMRRWPARATRKTDGGTFAKIGGEGY